MFVWCACFCFCRTRRAIIRQPKRSRHNQYLTAKHRINMNTSLVNDSSGSNFTSMNSGDSVVFCLPPWILYAIDIQSVYISDIGIVAVNFPLAVFAALVNLAVIVTVKRTPALHRPVNVLLCSLAAADCLSGLVAQPIYATWRLLLHHTTNPCVLMLLYQATQSLPFLLVGCTFLNLAITSVERLFAVSKPIVYSTRITLRGMQ